MKHSFISSNKNSMYFSYLRAVCSLSKLFSESEIPFLYYRVAENIFCKAFDAINLSRDDLAYDAKIGSIGIGIKTFIDRNNSFEKIAEFNSLSSILINSSGKKLALKLGSLRNERIGFANRNYGINKAIYHCITRDKNALKIFETNYDLIDLNNISDIKQKDRSIYFNDKKNEYLYFFSKSTLFKRFITPQDAIKIKIDILNDPLELIVDLFNKKLLSTFEQKTSTKNYVILPLYSLRESKQNQKVVSQKSGLNQWNAGGRKRDYGEVYIPVPKIIHNKYPDFFPARDTSFNLIVPTGEKLSAKLCQDNSKALMTNPNNALSDWLLRKVLRLKEGELLTYEKLMVLGIDSVKITKIDDQNYQIDFDTIDSFEDFINNDLAA